MRRFEHRRYRPVRMASLVLALVVTGCSALAGQATGELGRMQSLSSGCPGQPLLTEVDKDVSGSQNDPAIEVATLVVVRSLVEESVACAAQTSRGHLTVRLFATNASQTATLLDTDIVVDGATDIARQRRVVREQLAERLFEQVTSGYADAVAALPRNGSDVLARFALAGEAERQLEQMTGSDWALQLVVLTDGFSSTPTGLSKVTAAVDAEELAARTRTNAPPGLESAWRVSLVGVGRSAGNTQPDSSRIEAVKAFWRDYLAGVAERVTVATDFPGALAAITASEGR
ncbi:MAG TPA: hypothetical protein PKC31_00865 [Candidatus Nanoperiomorbaceae bacterium]|nr:hypothetical protein [Candidatus Nanoperiomorbaceae bacterium]